MLWFLFPANIWQYPHGDGEMSWSKAVELEEKIKKIGRFF